MKRTLLVLICVCLGCQPAVPQASLLQPTQITHTATQTTSPQQIGGAITLSLAGFQPGRIDSGWINTSHTLVQVAENKWMASGITNNVKWNMVAEIRRQAAPMGGPHYNSWDVMIYLSTTSGTDALHFSNTTTTNIDPIATCQVPLVWRPDAMGELQPDTASMASIMGPYRYKTVTCRIN